MQRNMKLQSVIDSQFAQARPPPVVETAATTLHTRTEVALSEFGDREYVPATSKAAPAAKPSMPTPGTSSWTPTTPPIFGPSTGVRLGTDDEPEIEITYLNPDVLKGPLKVKFELGTERPRSHPEGMTDHVGGIRNARSTRREGSPTPIRSTALLATEAPTLHLSFVTSSVIRDDDQEMTSRVVGMESP